MQYEITPPKKRGEKFSIQLPASKSISNRVLIMNALSGHAYPIDNLAQCDDTDVMVAALKSDQKEINIGAAGTSMRFLTAYYCGKEGRETVMTGSERMKKRPIGILVNALKELGATIDYEEEEGFPPLKIKGHRMPGGAVHLDGSVSSQYISALLMLAPTLEKGLQLTLENKIVSRPYIDMTLNLMKQFGIKSEWKGNVLHIAPQVYKGIEIQVESDWSASSYWYEIGAQMPHCTIDLPLLYANSVQGDHKAADLFAPLGITTQKTANGYELTTGEAKTNKYEANLVEQPDLAQTVVVTCLMRGIPFELSGLDNLKIKETDRIAALINESAKLGYPLTEPQEGHLQWDGKQSPPKEQTAVIKTYKDHRMAMAFAPYCLKSGSIIIEDPEVVSKSYPNYWEDLKKVGFGIKEL